MCEPIMRRLIGSPQAVTDSTGLNPNDPSWRTHPPAHLWVGMRFLLACYAEPDDDTGQNGADHGPPLRRHNHANRHTTRWCPFPRNNRAAHDWSRHPVGIAFWWHAGGLAAGRLVAGTRNGLCDFADPDCANLYRVCRR